VQPQGQAEYVPSSRRSGDLDQLQIKPPQIAGIITLDTLDFGAFITISLTTAVDSMDKDHEAEARRRAELAPTRDVFAPSSLSFGRMLDPERLRKAIRYLNEHPVIDIPARAPTKPAGALS
jgi:hypothetical protein